MSVHPISLALAATLLTATVAESQRIEIDPLWVPDARLAAAFAPFAYPVETMAGSLPSASVSRSRHAVVSVLAGAMLGTVIGVLEGPIIRPGCAVPERDPTSICSGPESSDRPILIGALLGGTVGFLYHLAWSRHTSRGQ